MILSTINFCAWAYVGLCEAWGDGEATLWEPPKKGSDRRVRRGIWVVLGIAVCTLESVNLSIGWERVFLALMQ